MQSPEAGGNWPIRLPAADDVPDLAIGDGPPPPGTPRGVPGFRTVAPSPEEFAGLMRIHFPPGGHDEEAAHGAADQLMCDTLRALGYGAGVTIFEAASKWYA